MAWAKRQQTGSQGAKSVLRAIADYADEDGCCWPSQRQISLDCEMSISSVARHLTSLEAAGFMAREVRLRDNGSRSSDMIRLSMRAVIARPSDTPPLQIGGVPPCQIEGAAPAETGGAPRQIEGAHNYQSNHHLKKTPHSPPEGGGVGKAEFEIGEDGEIADPMLRALLAILQPDPTFNRKATVRRWRRMTGDLREAAVAGAQRFVDHCNANKRRRPDPAGYLRDERWKTTANLPAPAPKPEAVARPVEDDPVTRDVKWALFSESRDGWVFVEEGSDDWLAWKDAFTAAGFGHRLVTVRRMGRLPDGSMIRQAGRSFPRARPRSSGGAGPPGAGERPSDDDITEHL